MNNLINRKQESLTRVINYINGLPLIKFILIATVIRLIVLCLLIPLYRRFPLNPIIEYDGNILLVLFMICITGPIRETFLFQFIPLELLKVLSKKKKHKTLHVIIAALIFGIVHFHHYENIAKVIDTISGGIILGYTYVSYSNKEKNPFWTTTALHGFINLVSLVIEPVFLQWTNIL